ncbi:hypothetical protein M9458_040697, partial [Cirrhinus mrigala]
CRTQHPMETICTWLLPSLPNSSSSLLLAHLQLAGNRLTRPHQSLTTTCFMQLPSLAQ